LNNKFTKKNTTKAVYNRLETVMMNVNTMRLLIDPKESGQGQPDTVVAAASRWGYKADTISHFRSSCNFIYRITSENTGKYLRLSHQRERSLKRIQAELDFMAFARRKGINTARPLVSKNNRLIEEIVSRQGSFYAVMFEEVPGIEIEVELLDTERAYKWGLTLGQLHKISTEYKTPNNYKFPGWRELIEKAYNYLLPSDKEAEMILDKSIRTLETLPDVLPYYGLLHYDFELDNIIWNNQDIYVLDFDDLAFFWFAADIAFALSDVIESDLIYREKLVDRFIDGYRTNMEFTDDWFEKLPLFHRLNGVLKYARLLNSYKNADPADDPPWLASMRQRHENWLSRQRNKFAESIK
jgi:Ser/Thr protein kinase RdoA (MazF antagonist)